MRNVSERNCNENKNAYFVFNNFFFDNSVVFEIMWKKYIAEPDRPQMKIWRTRIAC